MARTQAQIEQEIETEANSYTELAELQSNPSLMEFWKYAKKLIAFFIVAFENMLDKHKEEVEQTIDNTETGLTPWYIDILKEYQHGDILTIENNRFVYPVIDETKRIVKRVAIKEGAGTDATLYIKAVKEVAGDLVKFTATEKAGVEAYLNKRKILGTKFNLQSLDANLLELTVTVQLDAMLYDTDGSLLADPTTFPVLDAIEDYNKNFDFGGTYYNSKLIDTVMNVPGVIDFHLTATKMDTVVYTGSKESTAGHVKLDVPNSTLTYVLA